MSPCVICFTSLAVDDVHHFLKLVREGGGYVRTVWILKLWVAVGAYIRMGERLQTGTRFYSGNRTQKGLEIP